VDIGVNQEKPEPLRFLGKRSGSADNLLGAGVNHSLRRDTAYERILDRLREIGKRYRDLGSYAQAQCPSHDDRDPSLTIYRKPGRIKLVCHRGCHDQLDILPALGLTLQDLWDEPRSSRGDRYRPDPRAQALIEARRKMTPVQRALYDLLQLPDLGERLCRCIAAQGGGNQ
jgi:hypothetical protein